MNRLRRRIPWIIVPLLLIVPLILVACGGGVAEEDVQRIVDEGKADQITREDVVEAVREAAPTVDTEALAAQVASDVQSGLPDAPTVVEVAALINAAVDGIEIPDPLSAEQIRKIAEDVAEGTINQEQMQEAIAMALAMAAEEAAMAAAMKAEEEAVIAIMEEEELLRQIYASFFDGQTIRLLVGFSAGGGYDTYGRAIARHIGKHIPGNPDIIVENMTGAGSLVAANHLYNQAEPDGLTVGLWNSNHIVVPTLVDDPEARGMLFDGAKFGWLGAPSDGNPVCAIMGRAGATDASEILAPGTTYKHGSTAPTGGPLADIPHTTNAFLGTKHKVVSDYRGTAIVRLALQNGEVDAACWGWESMGVTARSMLDAEGDDQFIPYVMTFPSDDPEIADLPLLGDLFEDPEQKALWDLWRVGYQFQRPWTTPPGTAPELVDVMQEAFTATMADPDFIADAQGANLYLNPQTGDDIEQWVAQMLSITPEQKEAFQFLVTPDQE